MNAKFMDGLIAVRDGINMLLDSLNEEEIDKKIGAVSKVAEPALESKPTAVKEDSELTPETLENVTYNVLKKLAKERGINAKGTRDELVARLLGETEEETLPESTAEVAVEEPVETLEIDPLMKRVLDAVKDLSNEDIADILSSVGISPKGKRESLVDKVAQAVRDGLIEIDDEDSDESDDTEVVDFPVVESDSEDTADVAMTEERKEAIKQYAEDVHAEFKEGKLTRESCCDFLQGDYNNNESFDKLSDEELLSKYVNAVSDYISDDGEIIDEMGVPYSINDVPYCCGLPLEYDKKSGEYTCKACGSKYSDE